MSGWLHFSRLAEVLELVEAHTTRTIIIQMSKDLQRTVQGMLSIQRRVPVGFRFSCTEKVLHLLVGMLLPSQVSLRHRYTGDRYQAKNWASRGRRRFVLAVVLKNGRVFV